VTAPRPYYEENGVTIYHGRCEDVLPTLSGVGLVLTSPPYNLSGDGWDTGGSGKEWTALASGYNTHDDALPHSEYVAWQRSVLEECWATLTDDGAIFYNHKPIARGESVRLPLELNPDLPLRQVIVWDRGSGFCRNRTHFVPAHEWIMLLAKPAFRTTTRSVDDVWRIPFETGSEHPAPFPLSLARRAVDATTAELVVDPFCGSGTTLRAAKDAGRRAVGIELSERYCEIAAKRLAQGVLDFGGSAA
jgi:site-specific DNA-methyltransferase (adenine-specific)